MNWKRWIFRLLILLVAIALGYWLGHRSSGPTDENSGDQKKPVAQVELARIEKKEIAEDVTAYGSVIAQPGKSHSVSAAFETRVRHILVAPGEAVTVGQPLVEIDPSPAVQLQLAEAQSAAAAGQKELDQVEQRFNLKLATNQELGQAKKAGESAQLQLQSLQKQGAASQEQVVSEMAGLVAKMDVQDGQIVAAGSPLVELVARDEVEAKIGVEPEDIPRLSLGQAVELFPVHLNDAHSITAHIRLLTERVNADTRLVDVYVTLPPQSNLLLDSYLRAEMKARSHDGLVVPRSAVLPTGGDNVLFTVKNKRAVRHLVQLGIQNAKETEVISPELKAGELAVVRGNYELTDGMAVAAEDKP